MRKNISTVVEITDTHIKLLQAKHGRGVICACDFKEITEPSDGSIVKSLKEMLPRAARSVKEAAVIIPRRFAILKPMRLPSHHDREIRKMISLQLVSQIPYPPDDVVYDYLLLEKEPSGYARVLVVIVHKDVSGRYITILKDAGVAPREFVLSSVGLVGWLVYQQGKKKFTGEGAVMVVNVDAACVEICFCHRGKLLFSRSILGGAKDLGTDGMGGTVHQIELTQKNYLLEQMGPAPARGVIVAAAGEGLSLKKILEERLKVPFETAAPSDNILFQKNIPFSGGKRPEAPSFAAGLGVLVSDLKEALNLTPKEVSALQSARLKSAQRMKIAFWSVLVIGLVAAIGAGRFYKKMVYLRELQARSARIERGVKDAKQKIRMVEFFDQEWKRRPVMSGVIHELLRLMPQDVSLRSIYLDEQRRLSVQGYAQAATSVNNFQAGLVKSAAFAEVNLEYASKRKIFNMEVTDFKISFKLSETKGGR